MDIYLGLGSNLGDRRAHLAAAVSALGESRIDVVGVSPVVESAALLPPDAPPDWNRPFLNCAVRCRTALSPEQTLDLLKAIEARLGREPGGPRWAPRPIDLDILLWGRDEIRTGRLVVPHPELTRRSFVLAPLVALNARLRIPGHGSATVLEHSRALRDRIPLWMGILNVTPDSFSDGAAELGWHALGPRVEAMLDAGAQIVDLGAESTRPGAAPLGSADEWARLEPILAQLTARLSGTLPRPLVSVDTYHADVARRALALGADMINDVGGLESPAMIELAAEGGADFVAMHSLTVPADRTVTLPPGSDPVDAVLRWLDARTAAWEAAGIPPERILFDPGIGFGKTPLQSLELLRNVRRFQSTGFRCLVGHSRKSFMAGLAAADVAARDLFTLGVSLRLCEQGVDVIRVHDVALHVGAYRGWAHVVPEADGPRSEPNSPCR